MMEHVRVPSAPVSTSTHAKFKTVAAGAVVSGMVTNLMSGVQSGAVFASITNIHSVYLKKRERDTLKLQKKYNLKYFQNACAVITLRCQFNINSLIFFYHYYS